MTEQQIKIDQQVTVSSEEQFEPEQQLDRVMQARRQKIAEIRALGINPYPYSYNVSHTIAAVLDQFDALQEQSEKVTLAGRIVSIRVMGKAAFAHIQDETAKFQFYIKKNQITEKEWDLFKLLDIGDVIGVKGTVFITRTEEKSLNLEQLDLLAKNLRPLPSVKEKDGEVWNKWSDKEERYRHRAVDLIVNRESFNTLNSRSRIIWEMRKFFDEIGFIEVETPVLQPLYGGAAARPFSTFYNALDQNFYLRIADELYLKRLIAGGMPRVFEIAKDFRNEGIDRFHSPEFTMMECYAAYEDYTFCMDMLEQLIPRLAHTLGKTLQLEWEGNSIDLTPPFRRVTMSSLAKEHCDIEIENRDRDELAREITDIGIKIDPQWGVGKLIDELFSERIEHLLINPTFVLDYPIELSPLAKVHRYNPHLVERFELFIGGFEMANSFSELNDPVDQRARFEEQVRLIEGGDDEAHPIDENYIQALELGMPPTAGLGVGIDRLVMLLTGTASIRDVILFPALRTKTED